MSDDPFLPDDPELEPEVEDRGVVVYTKGDAHLGVTDAIPHLAASGLVYQRGYRLVQVLYNKDADLNDKVSRDGDTPVIHQITGGHLWEIMARCVCWQKYDGRAKKLVDCEPPTKVVQAIHGRGTWPGVPHLSGISAVPIIREDGRVHTEPGYDEVTGLFYAPNGPEPIISGAPTHDDAVSAMIDLLEVVQDFPFVAPEHRSAWLATVLYGVARPLIRGSSPMTVIDANTPGTGKSLLVDVSSMLVTGSIAAKSPPIRDNDELKKVITSHLLAGDQICCIDNVPSGRPVGWQELDNALTAGVWSDRELGRNKRLRLPMSAQWFVTGNNISIQADTARRTLIVRLKANEAHPEFRTGFKWHPIIPEVARARPWLLGKAINAIRAYLAAGSPSVGVSELGGFESWSSIVRNTLIWAGMPDPVDCLASNSEGVDEEHDARVALLTSWPADIGGPMELSTNEFLARLERTDNRDLREAVEILCPTRGGDLPSVKRMTWTLRSMVDRIHAVDDKEYVLRKSTESRRSGNKWIVEVTLSATDPKTTGGCTPELTLFESDPDFEKVAHFSDSEKTKEIQESVQQGQLLDNFPQSLRSVMQYFTHGGKTGKSYPCCTGGEETTFPHTEDDDDTEVPF